jgi:hypothetical protein
MASWTAMAQIATSLKTAKDRLISLGDARRISTIILSIAYFKLLLELGFYSIYS